MTLKLFQNACEIKVQSEDIFLVFQLNFTPFSQNNEAKTRC